MLLACKLVKCLVTGAWILQAVVVLACNLYMPVFQHAICMQPCDFFCSECSKYTALNIRRCYICMGRHRWDYERQLAVTDRVLGVLVGL